MNLQQATIAKGKLKDYAKQFDVVEIADNVIDCPEFFTHSAASREGLHHYGDYGLITHTHEVVELSLRNACFYGGSVDRRTLFLAALYHDFGKIEDYQFDGNTWGSTNHKYLIHHISRSSIKWIQAEEKYRDVKTRFIKDDVLHCILSHHGRKEWGSPIEPQTKEAWILHLCDHMSARVFDLGDFK